MAEAILHMHITAGRSFPLHVAGLGSVLDTLYDPLNLLGVIPEYKTGVIPEHHLFFATAKRKQIKRFQIILRIT